MFRLEIIEESLESSNAFEILKPYFISQYVENVPEDYKITLKCTVDAGQFYRMVYPGKVVRGYHCPTVQQPYWNTIYLDDFPDEELLNMIDHSYETVWNSFSKKVQKQILEEE